MLEKNINERRSFLKWSLLNFFALFGAIASNQGLALAKNRDDQFFILEDAPNVVTDASLGSHCRLVPTRDFLLLNPINAADGQRMVWEIIQDSIGRRQITLDTKFVLSSDINKIVLTHTPRKRSFLTGIYDASVDKWHIVAFVREC